MAASHTRPRRSLKWSLIRVTIMLLVGMMILQGCVMLFEDRFIYFPTRYPDGYYKLAEDTRPGAPDIEDVWLTTADGVRIHGWYCTAEGVSAATADEDRQVVLQFHGNAGNLTHREELIRLFTQMQRDFFIIDYRGYGRSEGSPSEQGLYADARAAWDHLTKDRGIADGRIIVMGKSLGAAPAVELATQVRPGGLIVESAFTSVPDMARTMMPLLPTFTLSHRMDSISKIGRVACPILVTHSPDDEMIPYEHGRRLFEAAPQPKWFHEVKGAGHNEMQFVGGEAYREAVRLFLDRCAELGKESPAPTPDAD